MKTRLIGDLDAQQAAQLHDAFVRDLVDRLRGGEFELRVAWALEPGESAPDCDLPAVRQQGSDLGERLFEGLESAAQGSRCVAAIGSDHPELSARQVEEAFERLEAGADVVLGPTADGGYYLIAVRPETLDRSLFEGVAWSTSRVLDTTLARCRSRGLAVDLLPLGYDVDTPGDLERLARQLASRELECPRTRSLLAGWNRLPAS